MAASSVSAAAARYYRAGFRAMHDFHVKNVLAAEARLAPGTARLSEVEDRALGLCVVGGLPRRVLLVRMVSVNGDVYWSLPKGHADPGESDVEAALREVAEETGVALAPEAVLPGAWRASRYTFYNIRSEKVVHKTVLLGVARYPGASLPHIGANLANTAGEVEEAAWVAEGDLATHLSGAHGDYELVRELLEIEASSA